MIVRELDLDLDAFEGPFDLLLTLVLKDELDLREVDVAGIVLAFLERLAEREELDLEACGEFLVLIAALLELKARGLFPEEAAELAELEPEAAAEELARRLAEYRRMKEAAAWLRERLQTEGERFFRLGPAPLAPRVETALAPQDPERLAQVIRLLAVEPPQVSLEHMALRFPPVLQFLERFRAVLRRRTRFDFDGEVGRLSRIEQAVAFLALLELRRSGEITIDQAAPFAPIRVARTGRRSRTETKGPWRGTSAPPDCRQPARPARPHARGAARRRLRTAAGAGARRGGGRRSGRVEAALGLVAERYREGRSGVVLEHVAGGWAFRASREAAEACARLFERPAQRNLSAAAMETLAIVAYLGPCSRPDIARIRGVAADSAVAGLVERGLIAESGRDDAAGAIRYRTTPLFERIFGLESLSQLPRLDDLGAGTEEIRERLDTVAEKRTA